MTHLCKMNGCTRVLSFKHSTDPDEGYCIYHGVRYVNVPLDIPKADGYDSFICVDCGAQKGSNKGIRCKPCSSRYVGNLNKPKGHSPAAEFVIAPRVTDYVPGSGLV